MSAAAVPILDPAGQPARARARTIENVSALPSVWELDATIEWLVEGMIPRASVNLISAESGTGKTWLAYGIAGAVAHGASFIGRTVQTTPVVYFDGENPLYVVKRNLTDLGIAQTANFHVWGGWNEEPPPGPADARIVRFAHETRPLLIWDSLVEFARCDEQSSTEMREFMKLFRRLAHLGATVVVLHHTGKSKTSKDYRGSSDIKASVDMAYVVTGHERQGKLHRLEMNPFKSRIAPGQDFAMEFSERYGFTGIELPKQSFKTAIAPAEIIRKIVRDNPRSNGTQIKNLAREYKIGRNQVDDILCSGGFSIESGRGAAKLYTVVEERLPDFPNPGVEETGKPEPDTG